MAWRMPWNHTSPELSDRAFRTLHDGPPLGRRIVDGRRQHSTSRRAKDSTSRRTSPSRTNTSEDKASQVFKSFRGVDISEIEATFIRRTIITVAQNAAGQMSLSELISSKRDELQGVVQKDLSAQLSKMGFTLDKVNLGASHLPQTLEVQMQQKMAAQQQAQQAEYELQKQQMLAKAAVAKAEGEAQSVLVRAKAESEANRMLQATLSGILIQNKTIEKWNGTLPQVTGGAMPMLDLNSFKNAAK